MVRDLKEDGVHALNYIDDFWGVVLDEPIPLHNFSLLHGILKCLCIRELLHKASLAV